jgi:serine/threonine protein kinase/Flp pilus assembly protein TadD
MLTNWHGPKGRGWLDMIGETINHYKITAKLGEGGMGEVYLADDTSLDRKVALKFLPQSLAQDPEARQRLIREAKAASRLSHPNIMTVYAVEEADGRTFIAMEYVRGAPLTAESEPRLDRIIGLAIQIADGLAKAHASGVVHRDIKPSNILIDSDGRPRILDFGLARLEGAAKLTKTGSTLGTIAYTSPEQASGKDADHRSDIFSLGTVIYELITGHLPFAGEHEAAIIYAITNEEPHPLARYNSKVPDELQRIITKCLQKDPARRYQSSADLSADLQSLKAVSVSGINAPAAPRPRLWQGVAAMAIIAVLAVAAFYVIGVRDHGRSRPEGRPMLAVLPFENLGSADDEYFADGITEEITTQVAKVSGLGVISRTSSIKYKNTDKTLKQIGDELGVNYVLEGTIRWDRSSTPARVRINPQLIRVADDTHLWADTYDREMEHIFATQSDIARHVVTALNVTLLDREDQDLAAKPTSNLKAYEAYLRGLEFASNPDFSEQDARDAIQMFEESVSLDSSFAIAYAQLSTEYSMLHFIGVENRTGLLAKSRAAVDRALAIDPDLPQALRAAGILAYRTNRDYATALRYFERALALRPGNHWTLSWVAAVYRRQGHFARAIEQYQKARTLDPLDSWMNHELGWTYMRMRRYDEALAAFDRSIELAPEQTLDYRMRAVVHWYRNGDLNAAASSLSLVPLNETSHATWAHIQQAILKRDSDRALDLLSPPNDPVHFSQEFYTPASLDSGCVLTLMGRSADAQAVFEATRVELEEELTENPDDHRVYSSLGIANAYLGNRDAAIRFGERGVELFPVEKDAVIGPYRVIDLAYIYTILGDYDPAMDKIEYLMSIPCMLSVAMLQLDPRWEPLQNHPRSQALIAKGDKVF